MGENKVFITGYSNANTEGVTLHFSGRTSIQSGGLKSDSWFVSWDKIGEALCGSEYVIMKEVEIAENKHFPGGECASIGKR